MMTKQVEKPVRYLTPAEASYSPPIPEGPFGPSMVEPCHNLSIEELLRDYTRGITHTERDAFYDDGDDVQEVQVYNDIAELENSKPAMPAKTVDEVGKPSETSNTKQSEVEQVEDGPGTEGNG